MFSRAVIAYGLREDAIHDNLFGFVGLETPGNELPQLPHPAALYRNMKEANLTDLESHKVELENLMDQISGSIVVLPDCSVVFVASVLDRDFIQKGDVVCIFLGGSDPLVIRRSGMGYKVVTGCKMSRPRNVYTPSRDFWEQQTLQDFLLI